VLLGGLLVSTFVTLVLVPSVFTLMLEFRRWAARRLGAKGWEEEGPIDWDADRAEPAPEALQVPQAPEMPDGKPEAPRPAVVK
ncbi:MAG TPA: hypothetical protein VIL46_09275, partial [Gemmataceae bacterium]